MLAYIHIVYIYIYIKHPNIPRFGKDSANVWNHQKFQLFLSLPCVHRNEPRPCNTLWDHHEGTNPYLWSCGSWEVWKIFRTSPWEGLHKNMYVCVYMYWYLSCYWLQWFVCFFVVIWVEKRKIIILLSNNVYKHIQYTCMLYVCWDESFPSQDIGSPAKHAILWQNSSSRILASRAKTDRTWRGFIPKMCIIHVIRTHTSRWCFGTKTTYNFKNCSWSSPISQNV